MHWARDTLTHCSLVTPYGDRDLGQVMACCLMAPTHTWTNVDLSSVRFSGIHLRAILYEIPQPPFNKISLKITHLQLNWNLPGANELISFRCCKIYVTGLWHGVSGCVPYICITSIQSCHYISPNTLLRSVTTFYHNSLYHYQTQISSWQQHSFRTRASCVRITCCWFLAVTQQLYEWFSPSVRLSVCLSVRPSVRLSVTPFWLCSHHPIIMKFSGVITSDKSDVHAKGQGQRSTVKVTEVTTQLHGFRTVTPVWIHIWWWDDAYSLIMLRRGALLFFKVICQISRSHGSKNRRIWPRLGVSGL